MKNYKPIGYFTLSEKMDSIWKHHMSASSIKKYLKRYTNIKQDKWADFKTGFIIFNDVPSKGKAIPIDEKIGKISGYTAVGEICEQYVLDSLKKTEYFKDIKVDKQRLVYTGKLINNKPFFSTEIDGFLGQDLNNITDIIEVKISKDNAEETKKKYKAQFQALLWLLDAKKLWLAHFHNVTDGKLTILEVEKDQEIITQIQEMINYIGKEEK